MWPIKKEDFGQPVIEVRKFSDENKVWKFFLLFANREIWKSTMSEKAPPAPAPTPTQPKAEVVKNAVSCLNEVVP